MKRLLLSIALLFALIAPAAAQFTSSGVIPLGNFQVGAAGTQVGTEQDNLQGMTALSCQVRFAWGSGGTQANLYIQSSLDQGQSWYDIANLQFGTASAVEAINLSGLNSVTTPAALLNLALTANTSFNGPLGDRLRATLVSTGIYSGGTLLSGNCVAR